VGAHSLERPQTATQHVLGKAEGEAGGERGEDVLHVEAAHERRRDLDRADGGEGTHPRPLEGEGDLLDRDVGGGV
jgi:hypothetical protein